MPTDTTTSDDMESGVLEAIDAIRPALQADGGDIVFKTIDDDGVVHVELVGACGTCPVSTMTLKASSSMSFGNWSWTGNSYRMRGTLLGRRVSILQTTSART